jgi:hypothetical protein
MEDAETRSIWNGRVQCSVKEAELYSATTWEQKYKSQHANVDCTQALGVIKRHRRPYTNFGHGYPPNARLQAGLMRKKLIGEDTEEMRALMKSWC